MKETDYFKCKSLAGTLSYRTCILRQLAGMATNRRNSYNIEAQPIACGNCARGKEIRAMFPRVARVRPVIKTKGRIKEYAQ